VSTKDTGTSDFSPNSAKETFVDGLLTHTATDADGTVLVATTGDIAGLDLGATATNPFLDLFGPRWATQRILLSMKNTAYIDSAAVTWLIACQRELRKSGGSMILHTVPDSVRQVLSLLRINQLVPIAANEHAARAELSASAVKP
jgi:anti-anti-sigma factor